VEDGGEVQQGAHERRGLIRQTISNKRTRRNDYGNRQFHSEQHAGRRVHGGQLVRRDDGGQGGLLRHADRQHGHAGSTVWREVHGNGSGERRHGRSDLPAPGRCGCEQAHRGLAVESASQSAVCGWRGDHCERTAHGPQRRDGGVCGQRIDHHRLRRGGCVVWWLRQVPPGIPRYGPQHGNGVVRRCDHDLGG